ncbi:hypothetical protein KBD08_00330 [Candidatus Babeliales bacterium]|nr:hypothetical protein [Candidatus Babeliales bacterium]
MTYKQILFLSLFLVPCTMFGKNTAKTHVQIDAQIQELEEKIFQKELELFKLSERIAEIDKLLLAFDSDSQMLLRLLIDKRVEKLKAQNSSKSLSQEDKDKIAIEVQNKANEFLFWFFDVLKNDKSIEGILAEGLLQKDEYTNIVEFESLKFYLIQRTFDRQTFVLLLKKYENCITEYRTLMNELVNLKKQR